jgi:hypothetical protein
LSGKTVGLPARRMTATQMTGKGSVFARLFYASKFLFNFIFAPFMHIDT